MFKCLQATRWLQKLCHVLHTYLTVIVLATYTNMVPTTGVPFQLTHLTVIKPTYITSFDTKALKQINRYIQRLNVLSGVFPVPSAG